MSDEETNIFARELIRLCVASLHDLNHGNPIPARWRDELDRELGPRVKRGIKADPNVAKRELEWARKMLAHRIAIEQGESATRVTAFAETLAQEASTARQTFTTQDVFKAERKWRPLAMSEEVWRLMEVDNQAREARREALNAELRTRLAAGQRLDEILRDPDLPIESFAAIRDFQNRQTKAPWIAEQPLGVDSYEDRAKVIKEWVHTAWRLHVGWWPPPIRNLEEADRRGLLPKFYHTRKRARKTR